jgi:Sulfotransferase family
MFAPWKAASSTMHARLEGMNESPYSRFYEFNSFLNRVVHQHITCVEFISLPEQQLGYLTASFVRNPYDRVYSGFRQLQRDIEQQPRASFSLPWIRELVVQQLCENFAQLCEAGFEFNRWFELITEYQIYEIGRNTSFPLHPSYYWTHVMGTQFVKFIGRVEAFETDFSLFCKAVGLGEIEKRNENVTIDAGSECPNEHGYRYLHKMNTKSIEKINSVFDEDFRLFGYHRI